MEILAARKAVSRDSGRFSRQDRICENSGLPPSRVERTVLSRAQGFCEACGAFVRPRGSPTGKPSLRLLPLAVSIKAGATAHDRLFAACGDCFRRLRREDANRRERERCLDRIRKLESALADEKILMVTAAILLDEEGKVLLAQRKPTRRHPASWEFPGGKVEPGEGLEDCLIREIREELGLRIQSPAAYLRVDIPSGNRYFRLFSFLAIRPPGEIRLREHLDAVRVTRKELTGFRMEPADITIARSLARARLSDLRARLQAGAEAGGREPGKT